MTVTITIDGKNIKTREHQSILDVAQLNGIEIPTLCYHKHLSIDGSCRLCSVEVIGMNGFQMACALQVNDGMDVRTDTPELFEARKSVLELLLNNYWDEGEPAENQIDTEFIKLVKQYNAQRPARENGQPHHKVDSDTNPVIRVDMNKCILCTRCVRGCDEIQGRFVWDVYHRGHDSLITAGMGTSMLEAKCETCGLCVQVCPTGALSDRMSFDRGIADRIVTTTCTYCGVGCQIGVHVKDDQIIRVSVEDEGPSNGIALCVKGRYGFDFVDSPDRLTKPMVREYLLKGGGKREDPADRGQWVEVDWDTALELVAVKFKAIKDESGPNAIGVMSSAKCTNEENYLMQKFARQVIGTHSIDHCARL